MSTQHQKLWPHHPKFTILTAILLVIILILITGLIRTLTGWPPHEISNTIIIGIFILSILPFLLSIMDAIIEKGGSIGFKDFTIEFTKIQQSGLSGFTIPANIGVPGVAVSDSGTMNILELLKEAATISIVVVDLEDGHAWWETRLLVLASGAERLGRPDKIVFVAMEGKKDRIFQGFAKPADILQLLLQENEEYHRSFYAARISARQWQLMMPLQKMPGNYYQVPQQPLPPWIDGPLSTSFSWMAFDQQNGLPNGLLAEQLFQHELGVKIESQPGGPKHISIARLIALFKPVFITDAIDSNSSAEQQMTTLFSGDDSFIALTQEKKYLGLVSRQTLYNEAFKNIFNNHSTTTR